MPQTLVPTDSTVTASSVDAVAAVFGTLRDGDAHARPAPRPDARRGLGAVAFMRANQAIARVEDAPTVQDAAAEVSDA